MACPSTCTDPELWGAAGSCNLSGVCVCPQGYSGRDDWRLYNDCRVNENLQLGVWLATALLSLLTLILAIVLVVMNGFELKMERPSDDEADEADALSKVDDAKTLARAISAVSHMSEDAMRSEISSHVQVSIGKGAVSDADADSDSDEDTASQPSAMSSGSLQGRPGIDRRQVRERKAERRTKRRTSLVYVSMSLLIAFPCGAMLYYAPFFLGKYRFENHLYQDLGLGMMASSIVVGLWMLYWAWYVSLPSLQLYTRLINVDRHCLVTRPRLVQTGIIVRLIAILFGNAFLCFGYFQWIDDSPEARHALDSAFVVFIVVLVLDFMVNALLLARVGHEIFIKVDQLAAKAVELGVCSPDDKRASERALMTIKMVAIAVAAIAPLVAAAFLMTGFVEGLRGRTYLSVNFCIALGNVAALTALYIASSRFRPH